MTLAIRPAGPDDLRFIVASWVDSYKTSHFAGPLPSDIYDQVLPVVVHRVMQRKGSVTLVACDPEDANHLVGFVCAEPVSNAGHVIHYLYIKQAFRKLGVARSLVAKAGIDASQIITTSFRTALVSRLESLHVVRTRFYPFIVRNREE